MQNWAEDTLTMSSLPLLVLLFISLVPRPPRPALLAVQKAGEDLDGFTTWCVPRLTSRTVASHDQSSSNQTRRTNWTERTNWIQGKKSEGERRLNMMSAAAHITWSIRPGLPPLFILQVTKTGRGGLGTRLVIHIVAWLTDPVLKLFNDEVSTCWKIRWKCFICPCHLGVRYIMSHVSCTAHNVLPVCSTSIYTMCDIPVGLLHWAIAWLTIPVLCMFVPFVCHNFCACTFLCACNCSMFCTCIRSGSSHNVMHSSSITSNSHAQYSVLDVQYKV